MAHLLELSIRVQNNFIAWHQRQHIYNSNNSRCETCSHSTRNNYQNIVLPHGDVTIAVVYPILLNNLQALASCFVTIIKKKKGLIRLDVSNIAISLLSFWNSKDIDNNVSETLLSLTTCVFGFYDATRRIDVGFANMTAKQEDMLKTIKRLINIKIPFESNALNAIYGMLLTEKFLSKVYISLVIQRMYNPNTMLRDLFNGGVKDDSLDLILSKTVNSLICLTSHNCNGLLNIENDHIYSVICNLCDCDTSINEHVEGVFIPVVFTDNYMLNEQSMNQILRLFQSTESSVRLNMVDCLPAICSRHSNMMCSTENLYWTNLFDDDCLEIKISLAKVIQRVVDALQVNEIFF